MVDEVGVTSIITGFLGPLGKNGFARKPTTVNAAAAPKTTNPMVAALNIIKPVATVPRAISAAFLKLFMSIPFSLRFVLSVCYGLSLNVGLLHSTTGYLLKVELTIRVLCLDFVVVRILIFALLMILIFIMVVVIIFCLLGENGTRLSINF